VGASAAKRSAVGLALALVAADAIAAGPATDARSRIDRGVAALEAGPPGIEALQAARADFAGAAAAGGDADTRAEALFRLAAVDERLGAFALALGEDRESVARAPAGRWAAPAAARAGWLEHRSEGGFAPLAQLERVRREPRLADDVASLEALATAARSFPDGPVRAEARLVVAEAWLGRLHRPREAPDLLRAIAGDASADPDLRRLAEHRLVTALLESGRTDEALREARLHPDRVDPDTATVLGRLGRRRMLGRVAGAAVLALVMGVGAALVRAGRRAGLGAAAREVRAVWRPVAGFAAFASLAGYALSAAYEGARGTPFVCLGAAAFPLLLVARAWGAVGSTATTARVARAAVCAAAAIGMGFLVLEGVDPTYLEGFGL
jgi:hypothetical protein